MGTTTTNQESEITPKEFETLFHLVSNAALKASSPQFEIYGRLDSKCAFRSRSYREALINGVIQK